MFLVNSRLGLFSAGHLSDLPLSLSYGVILPSSLTRVLSRVLRFSLHLRVSVYGTGTILINPRSFSWKHSYTNLRHNASELQYAALPTYTPLRLNHNPLSGLVSLSPSLHQLIWWYWNINQLSIGYAFRPHLRS